ncbi:hypothetical protein ACP4OV_030632 [Aristida adscensionis]
MQSVLRRAAGPCLRCKRAAAAAAAEAERQRLAAVVEEEVLAQLRDREVGRRWGEGLAAFSSTACNFVAMGGMIALLYDHYTSRREMWGLQGPAARRLDGDDV